MLHLQEESSEGSDTSESTASDVGNSGTSVGGWLSGSGRWGSWAGNWVSCVVANWVLWCLWGDWGGWLLWRVDWGSWLLWRVHWGALARVDNSGVLVHWDLGGVGSWDGQGGGRGDHVGLALVGEGGWLRAVGGVHGLVGGDSGWAVDWGRRSWVPEAMLAMFHR